MSEIIPTFDKNLERITTPEQAVRHLEKVLEPGGRYNPTSMVPEIESVPDTSDVTIFFKTDSGKYASTTEPYLEFLGRYNIDNGQLAQIPSYKFKIDKVGDWPYIRVRVTE